jgi:hypothetical protein
VIVSHYLLLDPWTSLSSQSRHPDTFDISHEVELPAMQERLGLLDIRVLCRGQRFNPEVVMSQAIVGSLTWLSCGVWRPCPC